MRVTHISPVPFGEKGYFGGGERYPVALAEAMAALTPTRYVSFADEPERTRRGDLDYELLSPRRKLRGSDLNPVSEQLLRVLWDTDVVHFHQWENLLTNVGVVLARSLGKRVYVTDHGGNARNYARKLRLGRLVDGCLNVSDYAGTFYPQLAPVASTIYGGVDVDFFRPDPALPRGDHALYVGRLLPHKGVDLLIQAISPQTPLRLVGRPYNAEYLDRLRGLAEGKRVTFVLDAEDETVRREYQQARVVVLPSLHHPTEGPPAPRAELLGLTLLEAMACGTPAICTRTGGMPEVVAHEQSGLVVEPKDLAGLDAALTRLVQPGPEWERMARQARERVEQKFTWTAVAERCVERYRDTTVSWRHHA